MKEENKKHIEHVRKQINIKIGALEEERKLLSKLVGDLWSFGYQEDIKGFECPLGKQLKDAICPECDYVLLGIGEAPTSNERDGTKAYGRSAPTGMSAELIEKCKANEEGCVLWRKKRHLSACGCGGTATCVCGYSMAFCFLDRSVCPYCERVLSVEYSQMYASSQDALDIFRSHK